MTKRRPLRPEDVVEEMLAADHQRSVSAYINAGRKLAEISADELQQRWVSAIRAMLHDRTPASFRDLDDINAEFVLRGLEPDQSQAADEIEAMSAEIERSGPNDPGVRAAIAEHLEKRGNGDS